MQHSLKAAVLHRHADGSVRWNARYLDFAENYGVAPQSCRVLRAQAKGKVEPGIRYVRGNLCAGLRFVDLADFNREALDRLDLIARARIYDTTNEVPFERLPLQHLQSLAGKPEYDTSPIVFGGATDDCFFRYDVSYYVCRLVASWLGLCMQRSPSTGRSEDEIGKPFVLWDEDSRPVRHN